MIVPEVRGATRIPPSRCSPRPAPGGRHGQSGPVAGPAGDARRRGEERTAAEGDVLFKVGDRRCPFIAIVEGEAAVLDAAGREIVRHGASGFLGAMNLLTRQTV